MQQYRRKEIGCQKPSLTNHPFAAEHLKMLCHYDVPFVTADRTLAFVCQTGALSLTCNATDIRIGPPRKSGGDVVELYGVPQDGPDSCLYVIEAPLSNPSPPSG